MPRRAAHFSVIALLALAVIAGCQKKITKIEPAPEPAPQREEAPPQPKFTPSDEDIFKPTDMDAQMREILVPVYFDYDKYNIRPDAISILEKAAPFLAQNSNIRVLLEGHADERGSSEYNMGLGESRARAVKNYLTQYGIPSTRIEITSYGRERPANSNCTDEDCHAKNRRVEWQVLAK